MTDHDEAGEARAYRGRISISIPKDVEDVLGSVENASAYIADAVRRKARTDRTRAMVERHGYKVTAEGVAAASAKLRAAEQRRQARREAA
jgi:hypothetical protein